MTDTMKYSVNGQMVDVPGNELNQFLEAAKQHGAEPDAVRSYRVTQADGSKQTVDVPDSQYGDFSAMAGERGAALEHTRRVSFANGEQRDFTVPELSKFLRSKEWREDGKYQADRDDFAAKAAKRVAPQPNEEDGEGFMGGYLKGLSDEASPIGQTIGGALSRFSKFAGMMAANARPMGTEAALSSREFHPEEQNPDEMNAGTPMWRMQNSVGGALGKEIDKWTAVMFPQERQTDSAVVGAVGKAVGLGAGLAEFALTPTAILAGGHFAEGMDEAFDAAKARGATDEEAATLGVMRGATDAAITTAFKNAPAHRIMKALGYSPAPAVEAAIAKAGEKGIMGVTRGGVATAVGKQMLANAAISASEMGVLGGLQAFIDDAVMQEAEKGTIDWEQSWKTLGQQAVEQGAFGAVMGLLPTPVKVREAVKARDAKLRDVLDDPMGVMAYANANPEAANTVAEAWKRDGAVSRKVARAAGLPEMDAAARNEIGEIMAKMGEEKPVAETPKNATVDAPPKTEATTHPEVETSGNGGISAENGAVEVKPAETEPVKPVEDAETATETPAGTASTPETPVEKPKRKVTGAAAHTIAAYSSDENGNSTGALQWHKDNGGRIYNIPVDMANTRPGGKVVLDKTDSAYERIMELLGGNTDNLRMSKNGKVYFTNSKSVPPELRELLGRELNVGKNPDGGVSRDDMHGVFRKQTDYTEGDTVPWNEVEQMVAADREGYAKWKQKQILDGHDRAEEKKMLNAVKRGKMTQEDFDIWKAERDIGRMEEELKANGLNPEKDPDFIARKRDLEVLKEEGRYPYEEMSAAKEKADQEWEGAVGEIESGDPTFGPTSEYNVPLTKENLQKAKTGDIIRPFGAKKEYTLDGYDANTDTMTLAYEGEDGVVRRVKVSFNGVEEVKNDGRSEAGHVEADVADAGGKGNVPAGAVAEEGGRAEAAKPAEARAAEEGSRAEGLTGAETRVDMRRMDPKLRSDPKVIAWAKKNGRVIDNGMVTVDARREYDAQVAKKTAKLTKNWLPDMDVVVHKFGEDIKRGQDVIDLRDRTGSSLGWFDPNSKEVHLLPGADAQTVAHEIMWHGSREWAKGEAGKGNEQAQKLLDKMREVEKDAPEEIKKLVKRLYRGDEKAPETDTLMNEYGAWDAMVNGGKELEAALSKRENQRWYARWWQYAKDLVKEFMSGHGKNRVDLSEVDKLTPSEFKDWMAKQFADGKTLGTIKEPAKRKLSTDETFMQKLRRKQYDINAAWRDVERETEKATGKKIAFDDSVEAENALTPGLREAGFLKAKEVEREYRKIIGEAELSNADLEAYISSKAAAGRDAKVDARNLEEIRKEIARSVKAEMGTNADRKAVKDEIEKRFAEAEANYRSTNGSHIDPREASVTIREAEGGSHAKAYKDASSKLREVMDETMDTLVESGLVSKESAERLRKEEPDYVPFKNEFDEETGEYVGRGTNNFTKPEFFMAKGRQSSAGDIVTHIFQDYLTAKHRAIENNVREKAAKFVEKHPELGSVEKLGDAKNPQKRMSDANDPKDLSGDPVSVVFKRNGESYVIRFNGTRGKALAAALTERNVKVAARDLPWYLGGGNFGAKIARWQAGLATRYAPYFSTRNVVKDNIELGNIVFSEKGAVGGAKWLASYAKNQKNNFVALSKYCLTGKYDAGTKSGKYIKDFIEGGGLISGGATEGYDEIKNRLDFKAIAKEMKRGKSKTAATFDFAKRSISFLNEMSELTTRVNVFASEYDYLLNKGVNAETAKKQAALYSRRATVDFNRKGENTGITNVIRLFSNSALGANARAITALAKSKYGKSLIAAQIGIGVSRVLLEEFMNSESDKEREKAGTGTGKDVSEFERKTSLFYARKGDNFYKVANHQSPFSVFSYAGDCIARAILGKMSWEDASKNIGVNAAEVAFQLTGWGAANFQSKEGGIGNDAKAFLVSVAPSLLQPIAETSLGVDYKGDPLYRTLFGKNAVKSSNPKSATQNWAVESAQWLNRLGGGNEGKASWLDVAPESIEKIAEGFGKNALRETLMTIDLANSIRKGEYGKLDARNKPIKRDYVRPIDGNTDRYYGAMNKHDADSREWDAMRSKMTKEERKAYLAEHPMVRRDMVNAAQDVRDARGKLVTYKNAEARINELRKLENGFVKDAKGHWKKRATPPSEEFVARKRAERLRLQAKFLSASEKAEKAAKR